MKVREILKRLSEDGWYQLSTKGKGGSHRQLKHPVKKGRVTVAGKPSKTLAKGIENSILKQAGLR